MERVLSLNAIIFHVEAASALSSWILVYVSSEWYQFSNPFNR